MSAVTEAGLRDVHVVVQGEHDLSKSGEIAGLLKRLLASYDRVMSISPAAAFGLDAIL